LKGVTNGTEEAIPDLFDPIGFGPQIMAIIALEHNGIASHKDPTKELLGFDMLDF
jgi:hypothetical protein